MPPEVIHLNQDGVRVDRGQKDLPKTTSRFTDNFSSRLLPVLFPLEITLEGIEEEPVMRDREPELRKSAKRRIDSGLSKM